jgi:hypothetical protein
MDALLLGELFGMLAGCPIKPFCLAGNHDLSESMLTPDTALAVTQATGLMLVIDDLALNQKPGCFALADIGGVLVGLGGSPYGMEIPKSVGWPSGVRRGLWITHEDMAFPGSYPGARDFFEIQGVEAVVNGHMHLAQQPVLAGGAAWHNPGNILRLSVDAKAHIPAVTAWTPGGGFKTIPLDFNVDVFNLAGKGASEAMPLSDLPPSLFADLMRQELDGGEAATTDDGGLLREEIEALAVEMRTRPEVRRMVDSLLEACVAAGCN